jgi:endoglucanase
MSVLASLILTGIGFQSTAADFPKVVSVTPVHDRLLCLHIDEGYVIHHKRGSKRSDETVVASPLNEAAAVNPASYAISFPKRAGSAASMRPVRVGRKSKGTSFAWFVDSWVNGRAVNTRMDHAKEHWIYLSLPEPLKPGTLVEIKAPAVAKNAARLTLNYNPASSRSESIHVNLLGWTPDSPAKYAYLYHWAGDMGSIDFSAMSGRTFEVRAAANGRVVHTGKVAFRKPKTTQETAHIGNVPPDGSFLKADVWEMDFSALNRPGKYVVSVPGVGCSFPFEIKEDVYEPAFYHVARALYHNRSGIALERPYTEFTRPAPHNPSTTPGFKGKLQYTTVRMQEWGSEGGDEAKLRAGFKGALDAWGWYQDAGDWDSYHTHLRASTELLFAYQVAPENFRDGDLNIPESGNGVPDILDEAAWLPRFCHRLRQELLAKKWGTGGIGLRVAGDAFGGDGEGKGSWQDVDRLWAVSGEDPLSTYRYAGAAAHLASALRQAGASDPKGVNWLKEARESYAWAKANTRPGDEAELKPHRAYAAAALFRLTGERAYEDQLKSDTTAVTAWTLSWEPDVYSLMLHSLPGGPVNRDGELAERLRASLLHTADDSAITTPGKRALRWGGNWHFPMLVGQQTTPWILEAAVAWRIVRDTDPAKALQYRKGLVTTADYFLGTNPLNMVWITGVGPRSVPEVFHMDAWYNGKGEYHPGLIPYGIWYKQQEFGEGPWSQFWPYKSIYPAKIEDWPGAEQYFSNRCSPMGSEFTIHQNIGPAAAIYGILRGPAKPPTASSAGR